MAYGSFFAPYTPHRSLFSSVPLLPHLAYTVVVISRVTIPSPTLFLHSSEIYPSAAYVTRFLNVFTIGIRMGSLGFSMFIANSCQKIFIIIVA